MKSLKKLQLHIAGTHCASCEVVIERKFKDVKGVERAEVDHVSGDATVWYSEEPRVAELNAAVHSYGYRVSRAEEEKEEPPHRNSLTDYAEIGAIFFLLFPAVSCTRVSTRSFPFAASVLLRSRYGGLWGGFAYLVKSFIIHTNP